MAGRRTTESAAEAEPQTLESGDVTVADDAQTGAITDRAAAEGAPRALAARQWSPRVSSAMLARLATRAAVADPAETIAVEAPLTAEILGEVPVGRPGDVKAAVDAARAAQPAWAQTTPADRARILIRFHDLLITNAREILDIIQLESGKARRHAYEEVLDTAIRRATTRTRPRASSDRAAGRAHCRSSRAPANCTTRAAWSASSPRGTTR